MLRYFLNVWGYFQFLKYSLNQIVVLSWLISPHPYRASPSVSGLLLLCPHTFMSTVRYGSCRSSLLISSFSSYLTGMLFSVCFLIFCQLLYFLNLLGLVTQFFNVFFSMCNHSSGDNI